MDGKLTTPPPENGNEQQLYDDVFMYLQKHEYRKDASKDYKRVVRRRTESFILRDGFVYLKRKMEKEGIEGQEREWIIDKTAQMRVIEACHDDKFGQYMSLMSVWHALPAVYEFHPLSFLEHILIAFIYRRKALRLWQNNAKNLLTLLLARYDYADSRLRTDM